MAPDDFSRERLRRARHLAQPDDEAERAFLAASRDALPSEACATVGEAEAWAASLEYHHEGQSRAAYLAHPFRVATMYLRYTKPVSVDGVVTALVHNVLEVTSTPVAEVERRLGKGVANALSVLTIDRARQLDADYLRRYYAAIDAAGRDVGAVKVLDKVDNLFVLCLNADEEVRTRYLREIDDFVVPLAERHLPVVTGMIRELVAENRGIGHRSLAVILGEGKERTWRSR